MGTLVEITLANALLAAGLAVVAMLVGRYSRRPALVHALWVLVLLKLVTPPLFRLNLPWPVASAPEPSAADLVREAPELPDVVVVQPAAAPPLTPPMMPAFTKIADIAKETPAMNDLPMPKMTAPIFEKPLATPPAPMVEPVAEEPAVEPPQRAGWEILPIVALLWLCGAVGWFLMAAWRIWRFQQLLRYARPAPEALQAQADALAEQLALGRRPKVFVVPGPVPPLLWAFAGRACLYFPESLLPKLEEPGRAALLVHELAHLIRRDHWVRWLELIVGCLYWWYPLVWVARNKLHAAEEECCDAWVVSELPGYSAAYAGALLDTIDFLSCPPHTTPQMPLPPIASGFGKMHQLKKRLTMIVRGSTPRGLSKLSKTLLFALAIVLPFTLIPNRAHPVAPISTEDTPPTKLGEPRTIEPKVEPSDDGYLKAREPSRFNGSNRTIQGAGGDVWAMALSPDEKTLAVVMGGTNVTTEGALTLYDMPSGKERLTLAEPKPIRCVAFSRDGKYLATGDFQHRAVIRNPQTGAIIRELKGHTSSINSMVFTADSKQLITASLDKTLKVWDVATGADLRTLTGHTDWVLGVALSPDGKTLVTVSKDETGRIWDLASGKTLHELKEHKGWIENCAISPDGKLAVTTGHDNSVKVWDIATGKIVRTLTGHRGVVNGAVFFAKGKRLATCSHDLSVNIWDMTTGNLEVSLAGEHNNRVYALAVTSDDSKLISGAWDRFVKVWDIKSREVKSTLQPKRYTEESSYPFLAMALSRDGTTIAVSGEERTVKIIDVSTGLLRHLLEGNEDMVAGVAFSPDGKLVAAAGFDGTVRVWDAITGKAKHVLKGHVNWVHCVTFSPDGKTIASGGYDRTIRMWDAVSGKETKVLTRHKGGVRAIVYSRDGKQFASAGTDKLIRIWDVARLEETHMLRGHEDAVRALAFSPDGARLVSGSEDNSVRLWDVASGKELAQHKHNNPVRALAWSPGGASFTSVGEDRSVRTHDVNNLTARTTHYQHNGGVTAVAYAPDSSALYTASLDRTIRVWPAIYPSVAPAVTFSSWNKTQMWASLFSPDGKWLATVGDKRIVMRDARVGRFIAELPAGEGAVFSVVVSPDGKTIAAACQDKVVRLYDFETRKLKGTLTGHKERVWNVRFSPDGKMLASACGSWEMADDVGEVKIWDLATNKELKSLEGLSASVQALAWSPDGKTLAVGSRDGLGRLYDAETGKERALLKGHKIDVRNAAFSPDGLLLATSSSDGTVRIWKAADGAEVATLKATPSGVSSVAWSPNGKMLAATSKPTSNQNDAGEVRLWDVDATGGFKEKAILKGHTSWVLGLAFSPDGKYLASSGGAYSTFGEVIIWDSATGKQVMMLHGHVRWVESVAWSLDGKTLVSAGGASAMPGDVYLWNVDLSKGWIVDTKHTKEIMAAAWSPDGKIIATGSIDTTIGLWDAATGKQLGTLKGHKGQVRTLAFHGKMLASGSSDKVVKLWDVETMAETAEIGQHDKLITSVAFSPDGKWLATTSADPFWKDQTGEVKVYEIATGREMAGADWAKKPAMIAVYTPDGKNLITGVPGANALIVYDATTGKQVRAIESAKGIRTMTLSRDGRYLATAHTPGSPRGNGSVQVWDTKTWREVTALLGHQTMCLGVAFSPDGKMIATASNDTTVKVWDLMSAPRSAPAVPMRTKK